LTIFLKTLKIEITKTKNYKNKYEKDWQNYKKFKGEIIKSLDLKIMQYVERWDDEFENQKYFTTYQFSIYSYFAFMILPLFYPHHASDIQEIIFLGYFDDEIRDELKGTEVYELMESDWLNYFDYTDEYGD